MVYVLRVCVWDVRFVWCIVVYCCVLMCVVMCCVGTGVGVRGVRGALRTRRVCPGACLRAANWVAEHLGASSRRPRRPFPALMAGFSPAVYLCTRP